MPPPQTFEKYTENISFMNNCFHWNWKTG